MRRLQYSEEGRLSRNSHPSLQPARGDLCCGYSICVILTPHARMRFPRSSGILLHPPCLPGPHGIGEFGSEAFTFVDFLKYAGQKLWQVLPLNPTGYGDSPFQPFSAHAGNPLRISLEKLREQGILEASDFSNEPEFPEDRVEFGSVIPWKTSLLKKAAQRFLSDTSKDK